MNFSSYQTKVPDIYRRRISIGKRGGAKLLSSTGIMCSSPGKTGNFHIIQMSVFDIACHNSVRILSIANHFRKMDSLAQDVSNSSVFEFYHW